MVFSSECFFEVLKMVIGQCDFVIDFSLYEVMVLFIGFVVELGKVVVIGIIGYNESECLVILSY